MLFVLKGFTPETGFRVFAFDGIAEDRSRTEFKVRADLSLIRTYGIRVQELPLLCRGLLERRDQANPTHTLTFTEDDMRLYATGRAAERDAAEKRKSRRAPVPQPSNGATEPYPSAMKMYMGKP